MERKEMKKRVKGLLALLLAFIMMFGTSLTVFAAGRTYELYPNDVSALTVNQKLNGGDVITGVTKSGGTLSVTVKSNGVTIFTGSERGNDNNSTAKYTLPTGYSYKVNTPPVANDLLDGNNWDYTVELEASALPTSDSSKSKKKKDSTGTGYSHEHYFQWVESIEPTEEHDGLMEFKCACGAVDDSYVMPSSMAFVKKVVKLIQTAPQNGTVDITTKNYSCYTAWIIEELAKRPDVSLKTTYTDAEGNVKTFTIPAGQAPTDGAEFYGFTYLGNKYGWN